MNLWTWRFSSKHYSVIILLSGAMRNDDDSNDRKSRGCKIVYDKFEIISCRNVRGWNQIIFRYRRFYNTSGCADNLKTARCRAGGLAAAKGHPYCTDNQSYSWVFVLEINRTCIRNVHITKILIFGGFLAKIPALCKRYEW